MALKSQEGLLHACLQSWILTLTLASHPTISSKRSSPRKHNVFARTRLFFAWCIFQLTEDLNTKSAQLFCSPYIFVYRKRGRQTVTYRVFSLTWPASMQISCNKRKRLHKKRVRLPQDWFGTPTWPPFHCFGTPIWPPWRHVKTLYKLAFKLYITICATCGSLNRKVQCVSFVCFSCFQFKYSLFFDRRRVHSVPRLERRQTCTLDPSFNKSQIVPKEFYWSP